VLVDVRTRAEWQFVGAPDLREISKVPVFAEWKSFPAMEHSVDFVERLSEALRAAGVTADSPIYFLCRSGARSRDAAAAMAAAGWLQCVNVSDGFEGDLDEAGHRGRSGGWKASGLPWKQT
jgi:rhodanese-related sulfurtransferase